MSMLTGFTSLYLNGTVKPSPTPNAGTWDANPIRKMEEKLSLKWSIFEGLDFVFAIIAIIFTVVIVAIFVYNLWGIIKFVLAASRGLKPIADKPFWIRIAVVAGIVFLFFSGIFWDILNAIYEWTSKQDVVG